MDLILSYLKDNKLPEDRKEAKLIKQKAPGFWVSKKDYYTDDLSLGHICYVYIRTR